MKGWIFTTQFPISYETDRLTRCFEDIGIDCQAIDLNDVDIFVHREGCWSILIQGQQTHIPNFYLPRIGVEITYYQNVIFRHLERMEANFLNSSDSIDAVKDKLLYTLGFSAA